MAGYGLTSFLIAQSLNQIEKAYGAEQLHPRQLPCPRELRHQRRAHRQARLRCASARRPNCARMRNYAGHRLEPWLGHVMVSRQETARPLLTPGEVMQLPPDDELVLVSGCQPIRAKKARYYEDRQLQARMLPPPTLDRHATLPIDRRRQHAPTTIMGRRRSSRRRHRDRRSGQCAASAASPNCPSMRRSCPSRRSQPQEFELAGRRADDDAAAILAPCSARRARSPGRSRSIPATTWTSEPMRTKHTFRLPPDLAGKLADYADRKRVPQALGRRGGARVASVARRRRSAGSRTGRRLDRMTRQIERLERHVTISNEALALFVRFWLTSTPPFPTPHRPRQAKGRERYEGFVEALGRRLARGRTLADEVVTDIARRIGQRFGGRRILATVPFACLSIRQPDRPRRRCALASRDSLSTAHDASVSRRHRGVAVTTISPSDQKPSPAARACCAPRSVRRSPASSKIRTSSRSCSIPTAGCGSTGCRAALRTPAARIAPADAERIIRLVAHHVGAEVHAGSPRVSAELPESGERFEGLLPPVVAAPCFAIRSPAVAVFTLDDYVAGRHHVRRAGRAAARGRARAQEHPGRRRHLDRQDHAGQRAARRGRQDRRPRGPDRGHARAAMRRAEPRRAAHQGRRRHAVRSGALDAAPAARPHPDRRGARRRSARSAQGLGHRPSRRHRHPPRRLRASARCAASSSSSRKPSSPCRAR